MSLADLWIESREELEGKHVQQIIAFGGSGKLLDGRDASREFREFLSLVPSSLLWRYADDCLTTKFDGGGLALQDIINQVGRRLAFDVTDGVYRGSAGKVGFDGIWRSGEHGAIVVEVKTTDTYRIDLGTIAGYRRALIRDGTIREEGSSILIIVGREDTGDLEAQIRGSRHAWDIRLISVDALLRLMRLKEEVEDPLTVRKIHEVLAPQEFTKLDGVIDVVFAAAEDVREGAEPAEEEPGEAKPKFVPVQFHDDCIKRIQMHLKAILVKRSRATFTSPDSSLVVICAVSREHESAGTPSYWYAFHPHQKDTLAGAQEAYVAFGCGSERSVLLIPFEQFVPWLEGMHITQVPDRFYWHVRIYRENGRFILHRKKGCERVDLTKFLLKDEVRA